MRPLLVGVMTIGILSGAHSVLAENVPTHCKSGEGQGEVTLFSCPLKKKVVSYCAAPAKPPYKSIEYRYGAVGKVEKTFKADGASQKKFNVNARYEMQATWTSLWFSESGYNFSLEECSGGMCTEEDGLKLVVSKGDKTISSQHCSSVEPPDDHFSRFPFEYKEEIIKADPKDPEDRDISTTKAVSKSPLMIAE